MSKFKENVIKAVSSVPYGKVASYGQIALMVGVPRAARQVGQVLRHMERDLASSFEDIPWWRIVNNAGRISIKGTKFHDAAMQKKKLEAEGLNIKDDLTFDIEEYRYRPTPEEIEAMNLPEEYTQEMITKYLIL